MAQRWHPPEIGGYLGNPELSRQIRNAAVPLMKFTQFVRPEPGYGKNRGDKILFNRISNVVTPGRALSETERIPETNVTISQGELIVTEYGNSIPYSGKLEALAEFSVVNIWTVVLRNDIAMTLDKACADQFRATKVVYTPTGTAASPTGVFSTTGAPATFATRSVKVWDVKEIVDYMKTQLLVPPYDGENYIAICSTGFLRAIKDDPEWIDAAKYGDPERLFTGEVGRLYKCRFIEETNVLPNVLGTTAHKGSAVFFGLDPVIEGVVIPAEIRARQPDDYGRIKGIAWYYLGGFKITWDTARRGECKIVEVDST